MSEQSKSTQEQPMWKDHLSVNYEVKVFKLPFLEEKRCGISAISYVSITCILLILNPFLECFKRTMKLNMWEGMDLDVKRYLNSGAFS